MVSAASRENWAYHSSCHSSLKDRPQPDRIAVARASLDLRFRMDQLYGPERRRGSAGYPSRPAPSRMGLLLAAFLNLCDLSDRLGVAGGLSYTDDLPRLRRHPETWKTSNWSFTGAYNETI